MDLHGNKKTRSKVVKVIKCLNVNEDFVKRTLHWCMKTSSIEDRPRSGHPVPSRSSAHNWSRMTSAEFRGVNDRRYGSCPGTWRCTRYHDILGSKSTQEWCPKSCNRDSSWVLLQLPIVWAEATISLIKRLDGCTYRKYGIFSVAKVG